jgi:L-ascorbate metabolism protein UlaG (beta-lactamase superfamily)
MIIRWLGQASFNIEAADGRTIRTDPFDESLGLPICKGPADVVTVSHTHFDHAAVHLVARDPEVVDAPGTREAGGFIFTAVPTCHDAEGGAKRGGNLVFCFEVDGVRLCHLGDLGHTLTTEQIEAIGPVDVLIVPVGGFYTIDAAEADKVIGQLAPKVVLPMHYKLPGMSLPIDDIGPFLKGKKDVQHMEVLDLNGDTLPGEQTIVVLTQPQ